MFVVTELGDDQMFGNVNEWPLFATFGYAEFVSETAREVM